MVCTGSAALQRRVRRGQTSAKAAEVEGLSGFSDFLPAPITRACRPALYERSFLTSLRSYAVSNHICARSSSRSGTLRFGECRWHQSLRDENAPVDTSKKLPHQPIAVRLCGVEVRAMYTYSANRGSNQLRTIYIPNIVRHGESTIQAASSQSSLAEVFEAGRCSQNRITPAVERGHAIG